MRKQSDENIKNSVSNCEENITLKCKTDKTKKNAKIKRSAYANPLRDGPSIFAQFILDNMNV